MSQGSDAFGHHNLAFVESMYAQWLDDPESVDPSFRALFDAEENGHDAPLGPSFGNRSLFNPPGGVQNGASAPVEKRPRPVLAPQADVQARLPYLQGLELFRDLGTEELSMVASLAEEIELGDGEVFVREGAMGRDLYIITSGIVAIRRAGRTVAELEQGETVGEMAVLDQGPRAADAVAVGKLRLLRVPGSQLMRLLDEQPRVSRGVIRVLTRRLRESGSRQDRADQLIRAYRVRGHLLADLDPLGLPKEVYPELNPAYYGFGQGDLDMLYSSTTIPGQPVMRLRDIIAHLRKTYCGPIGVQFMHIDDLKIKMWLQNRMEASQNETKLSTEEQIRILTKLTDAEIFEQFIHKKFIGAKRFSAEGAESMIPLLDLAVDRAADHGVEEIVVGMAHRGRLNVLANVIGKSPRKIFREFDDQDPDLYLGSGDVKYHLGYSKDRVTPSGRRIHLSLTFNPSHLECVNPVVLGRVRAKQDRYGDAERSRCMGVLIHGDAAFAGQGVVQETMNLSELHGYRTGGTLHIIVNNQIGFTTNPNESRSTQYATDVAKMLQIPILHVNGEHPDAVAQAVDLALAFRSEFKKDVVIDLYCYRRYGHNEGDEPAFTQPLLYKTIRKRKSVREGYLDALFKMGNVSREEADQIAVERRKVLEDELSAARAQDFEVQGVSAGQGVWQSYTAESDSDTPDVSTGVPQDKLTSLMDRLVDIPDSFTAHPKIVKLLEIRGRMGRGEQALDWGAGEALAFATLLAEGARVRVSGQDSQRGTFSHRHAVLNDFENGRKHIPHRHLAPDQGMFDIWNSPLSEVGVMGFEYGYSLDYPDGLVAWEAQFGDFVNVAQLIIDQFIVSGQDKWKRWSGVVLLLPHGYEGQGPEHSSARLERFLGLSAEENVQVANVTTPAQIFHLLRRQVVRRNRKPLIVMSPKSLLRHPKAVSQLSDLASGAFQRFIDDRDERVQPKKVRRVLLTSGKVYYDLAAERERREAFDVAIIRVEQLYPLRVDLLEPILKRFSAKAEIAWVQEEPWNMGAWHFMSMRLQGMLGRRVVKGVTRPESASPATGSAAAHKKEQALLLERAFSSEEI